jgi:hypothetical protein
MDVIATTMDAHSNRFWVKKRIGNGEIMGGKTLFPAG